MRSQSVWRRLHACDTRRREELSKLIRSPRNLRGVDYFRAAVVFLHGGDLADLRVARRLAHLGAQAGYSRCLRIEALAIDRELILQGKKQFFGTQFHRTPRGKWELFPYNPRTTDGERERYKVDSLQKLKNIVKSLNTEKEG